MRDRRPLGTGRGEQAIFAAIALAAAGVPVRSTFTAAGATYWLRSDDLLRVYRRAGPLRRLELRVNAKALGIRLPRFLPPVRG